jgi:hypothetical protein
MTCSIRDLIECNSSLIFGFLQFPLISSVFSVFSVISVVKNFLSGKFK